MVKPSQYVIINNRAYDPITGLVVDNFTTQTSQPEPTAVAPVEKLARGVTTPSVHRKMQKSETLNRRFVKKPYEPNVTGPVQSPAQISPQYSEVNLRPYTTQKSEAVNKFSHAVPVNSKPKRIDRPAETHPVVRRAYNRSPEMSLRQKRVIPNRAQHQFPTTTPAISPTQQATNSIANHQINRASAKPQPAPKQAPKPAHVIKNEAIYKALNTEINSKKESRTKKQRRKTSGWARFTSLATASLAIIMLAGYFTYLSMPNISIRMAAVQSGVNAKYPSYRPDGYSLRGPISFKDGEVSMRFAYAGGNQGFTLKQQRSNWDSSAVKHFASTKSDDTMTTVVDGLTIYTYDRNATWVNSGVLYTLESDAPLSSSQVQRVATSM